MLSGGLLSGRALAQELPPPQLILPLISAIAFGSSVAKAKAESEANPIAQAVGTQPTMRRGMLPSRLWIPDLYRIEYERDPLPFAAPVDNDRMVAFDLMSRPASGFKVRAAYDSEKLPIGDSREVFRLEFKLDF